MWCDADIAEVSELQLAYLRFEAGDVPIQSDPRVEFDMVGLERF